MPLGDLMQHAALHAMHHRGQAALLLRMLGYVPGNFDFLLYLGERRSVPALPRSAASKPVRTMPAGRCTVGP
jgi:hypothetical protein